MGKTTKKALTMEYSYSIESILEAVNNLNKKNDKKKTTVISNNVKINFKIPSDTEQLINQAEKYIKKGK